MGLSRSGRFAAVTNFRDFSKPGFHEARPKSRGNLVTDFLCSQGSAQSWADSVLGDFDLYGGFNLLIYDGDQLLYLNNFNNQIRSLEPGTYALSNHLLDSPWPKVDYARQQLRQTLDKHSSSQQMLDDLLGLLEQNKLTQTTCSPALGCQLTGRSVCRRHLLWPRITAPELQLQLCYRAQAAVLPNKLI